MLYHRTNFIPKKYSLVVHHKLYWVINHRGGEGRGEERMDEEGKEGEEKRRRGGEEGEEERRGGEEERRRGEEGPEEQLTCCPSTSMTSLNTCSETTSS